MNGTKLRRVWKDLPLLLNLPLLASLTGDKCRFKCRCRSEIPNELFGPKYSLTSCHSGQARVIDICDSKPCLAPRSTARSRSNGCRRLLVISFNFRLAISFGVDLRG